MDKQDPDVTDLEIKARDAYRDSLAGIDGATRSRLTQARHRALEELPKRRSTGWRWVPAGVAAAAAVVTVLLVVSPGSGLDERVVIVEAPDDLEILLGEDELEMIDELEFYAWIDELDELQDGFLEDGVG
jgi:hypothetical protein